MKLLKIILDDFITEGYEDERGFHYGPKAPDVQETLIFRDEDREFSHCLASCSLLLCTPIFILAVYITSVV